jgi:arylsulfatase A-like enzyme
MRILAICLVALTFGVGMVRGAEVAKGLPNVVLILADDLGVGELGCYGQGKIRTPHIDALAKQGMKFRTAYSPSPVCAPTRCSLLTGLHQGHAYIRDNQEVQPEGQLPIPAETLTLAEVLKQGGYATACVGKWGLGPVGSSGDPNKQGFDFFFGHNCQRMAHNHYTTHVWRNDQKVGLEGNEPGNLRGAHYAPDLMADEAVKWLKGRPKDKPFFLYFGTPLPHVSLQAPEEAVVPYRGVVKEEKKFEKAGGKWHYTPNDEPRATYAAMVAKVDEYVGRIVGTLKEMGVEENTIVIFASDNGPTFNGGADSAYFGSTMGRRGLKSEVYEGGIRVPLLVRWPAKVTAGGESEFVTVLYDLMPTVLEAAALPKAGRTDGVSLVPVLTGAGGEPGARNLYWEFGPKGGQKAVRRGKWKAVWMGLKKNPNVTGELYDLENDPNETTDLAKEHPDVLRELTRVRDESHEPAAVPGWNF